MTNSAVAAGMTENLRLLAPLGALAVAFLSAAQAARFRRLQVILARNVAVRGLRTISDGDAG